MTVALNHRELDYEARKPFIKFHRRNQRWAVLVAHRRAGKTVACVHELVVRALYTTKKNPRYAYVAPYYSQAKAIAWQYLKDAAMPFIANPKKDVRESDLSVKLINGAVIRLYGADNIDALRGIYLDGVVLDEFGDCRPGLWAEVILPTLADRKGWAVIIGTPKGKNTFYDMYIAAQTDDTWYVDTIIASQSKLIDPDELASMKAKMTDAQFNQEFECSFTAPLVGTYYAGLIETLELKEQIAQGACEFDPEFKVFVAADLGYTDSTALWFWQPRPDGFAVIDYEEAHGKGLEYYFDLLLSKPYQYETIWLPHDARAKTLQTGRSTVEQFKQPWVIDEDKYGFLREQNGFPINIAPSLSVQQGIEAVRLVLPMCHIEYGACKPGVEGLRAYRRAYDAINKVFSNTPKHDWASNPADGFRYFALVAQQAGARPEPASQKGNKVVKPDTYSLEDLFKLNEQSVGLAVDRMRI